MCGRSELGAEHIDAAETRETLKHFEVVGDSVAWGKVG